MFIGFQQGNSFHSYNMSTLSLTKKKANENKVEIIRMKHFLLEVIYIPNKCKNIQPHSRQIIIQLKLSNYRV